MLRVKTLVVIIVFLTSCSEKIVRWTGGKHEIRNQKISYVQKDDVFVDYNWTRPDIKSNKIVFTNNIAEVSWRDKKYLINLTSSGNINIENTNGEIIDSARELVSKGNIYYDKSELELITVQKRRWVSYTRYENRSVAVQRSKMVPYQQYNYATKSYSTQYRTQFYTAYEPRSVATTAWKWKNYTEYDVKVPFYNYYKCSLDDSKILIYKIPNKDSTFDYYIQNPTYLFGKDRDLLNYISIDANSNGYFFDENDLIMFNSWNPYSKLSSYKKPKISFLDNYWFTLYKLRSDFMLDIKRENNYFNFKYLNNDYVNSKDNGRIIFKNLPPQGAKVLINGKRYTLMNDKKYRIQYGNYKITILNYGFLEYNFTATINNANPLEIVEYKQTEKAGKIRLSKIPFDNYFVTITNSRGFYITKMNESLLTVPTGQNQVKLYSNGVMFSFTADVEEKETSVLNFEKAIKKEEDNSDSELPEGENTEE